MRRYLPWSLACVVFALIVSQAFASDSVLPRFKFTKDQLFRYSFSSDYQLSGEGLTPKTIHLDGVVRLRVMKMLPDGGAQIRLAVESCSSREPGGSKKIDPNAIPPMSVDVGQTGVVDCRFSAIEHRNNKAVAGDSQFYTTEGDLLDAGISLLSIPLPGQKVRVGDTWKRTLDNVMAAGKLTVDAKLLDTSDKVPGSTIASISSSFDKKDSLTESNGVSEANTHYDSLYAFDIDRGWPTEVTENTSGDYTFGPSGGEVTGLHATVKTSVHASMLSFATVKQPR